MRLISHGIELVLLPLVAAQILSGSSENADGSSSIASSWGKVVERDFSFGRGLFRRRSSVNGLDSRTKTRSLGLDGGVSSRDQTVTISGSGSTLELKRQDTALKFARFASAGTTTTPERASPDSPFAPQASVLSTALGSGPKLDFSDTPSRPINSVSSDPPGIPSGPGPALSSSRPNSTAPGQVMVDLSNGTKIIGSTNNSVDSFIGIRFAEPAQRLRAPQPVRMGGLTIEATGSAMGCPQIGGVQGGAPSLELPGPGGPPKSGAKMLRRRPRSKLPPRSRSKRHYQRHASGALSPRQLTPPTNPKFGEDCLNLNVQRPAGTTSESLLPVVFWYYGGAFQSGTTQGFDATALISNSVSQEKGIIYVAANYRVGAFGFLAGKEVTLDGAANLGLLDQRLALEWVADNIAFFGGDPNKVTIWGESAGSVSCFDQMMLFGADHTYKGRPLFRAAIMDSGSILPADASNSHRAQKIYDTISTTAGCGTGPKSLDCLRALPYDEYVNATKSVPSQTSYDGTALSFMPRPDGIVLTESPEVLVSQGKYAQVPFIIGDQEDEGTVFALVQQNLSTTADVEQFMQTVMFQSASPELITQLVAAYPDDPAQGSPFGTGTQWNIYPQYKRMAAILGDYLFTLQRRGLLQTTKRLYPHIKTYSAMNTFMHGTPVVGTPHGADLLKYYGSPSDAVTAAIQCYYINFINTMDPNSDGSANSKASSATAVRWPLWNEAGMMLNFTASGNVTLMPDTFREAQAKVILDNQANLHI